MTGRSDPDQTMQDLLDELGLAEQYHVVQPDRGLLRCRDCSATLDFTEADLHLRGCDGGDGDL